jgi:anti-sigma B factor antagonist
VTELARVDTEVHGEAYVVSAHGEIDISNAGQLLAAIEAAMPNGAHELVLDLTGVSYLDSAGVSLVLRLARRLQGRRQEMSLVAPEGSPVRAVLEVAGVPKVVPVLEAPAEAQG